MKSIQSRKNVIRKESTNSPPTHSAGRDVPWQLRMFSRTLKKKQRLTALRNLLRHNVRDQECLLVTCGDNNGAINYRLRELGGRWTWADCEDKSIDEMSELLGEEVALVNPSKLPFDDEAFDCVVAIDVHEHLEDPTSFTRQLHRVLRPDGRAIITVPGGDQRKLANRLKNLVGMTKEKYGHVRDGFSMEELQALVAQCNLEPRASKTFSRFFTEMLELGINFMYVKKLAGKSKTHVQNGTIAPATSAQLRSVEKTYRMYSAIYPFIWCLSRLDVLLPFTSGYVVIVEGRKNGTHEA